MGKNTEEARSAQTGLLLAIFQNMQTSMMCRPVESIQTSICARSASWRYTTRIREQPL